MSKLTWDQVGGKKYETGVSNGVLYPMVGGAYANGVAWNGLTGVTESPSGAEAKPLYADNGKYLNMTSAELFGATIAAYMYPDEFAALDGSATIATGVRVGQQKRGTFGLVYKTILGNDVDGDSNGYKIHIIYGAQAAPSEKAYASLNDSPDAVNMSWTLTTTPIDVAGFKPAASLVITSTDVAEDKLKLLEDNLFGSDSLSPTLLLPDAIVGIIGGAVTPVAMSTIVPADAASTVAVSAKTVVITFNNKIVKESIVVITAAGVLVPGTKAWDASGKVLTFTANANWTAATLHLVTLAGVVDVYNQSLATVVKKFTTAA